MQSKRIKHLMGFDFESWIFSERIKKENLSTELLRKIEGGYSKKVIQTILKDLKKNNQKITFFIVFKLEELYPGLIKTILESGHEIGWHGHTHAFIKDEAILLQELELSKKLLQKYKVIGYQAPGIIFYKKGYRLLKKYGFKYSSSIYGNSNVIYKQDGVFEIPVSASKTRYKPTFESIQYPSHLSVRNMIKYGVPYGSSYFWSILGKKFYDRKFRDAELTGEQVNVFIHNWQLISPVSKHPKYQPDERRSVLLNPLFYPYTRNVSGLYSHLIGNFKFQRFKDFLYEKKHISYSR